MKPATPPLLARLSWLGGAGLLLVLGWDARGATTAWEGGTATYRSRVHPLLSEYCHGCHGREKARGDLNLEALPDQPDFIAGREVWEKVRSALEAHEMPPEGKPQPDDSERRGLVAWLEGEFARQDASAPPNPGRVTARRLNRNEYRNTVRDLFGVDYDAHAEFPNDESGYGFDNIGDVLSLPPMLLEKYIAAAETIARKAILTEDPALKRIRRVPAAGFSTQADAVSTVEAEVWGFYREGEIVTDQAFDHAGRYQLRLKTYGDQAGTELPKLGVRVDGTEIRVHSVRATSEKPETLEVPISLDAGRHRFGVAYLNNFNADGDRNLYLTSFEIVGPLDTPAEEYPEPHRRILPRRPVVGSELAYAKEALTSVVDRAYRRPAKPGEVERLVNVVETVMKDRGSFEEGIQLAIEAILVSPQFLYRWEVEADPRDDSGKRALTDHEVASRLSYFLWSSMPDATLLDRAKAGELAKPEVRAVEVVRMLRDPRSGSLVTHFGGQWLQTRNLDQVEPDETLFPTWNKELRDAMHRETELFLNAILAEDRPITDLIDADFTFLNERLARHYGIEGVVGDQFRKVPLPAGSVRGGILTMGSVLTITSFPTRTAPVLRGKWILEQVLGTPPPPPPPNVPPLEEGAEVARNATFRQRLELHRSKAECMGCHQKMDPLGFALENFDGIGSWRTKEGDNSIDNSAELPGGRPVSGAAGLKRVLREHKDFPRAFTAKLLTYALGRGLEPSDRAAVSRITDRISKNGFKFSELVLGIVESEPFLKRQTQDSNHERHASLDR